MPKPMWVGIVCITLVCRVAAQQFDFPEAAAADPAALSRAPSTLASQIIVAYKESDQENYFDNLFRLQLVAGNFAEALKSIGAARDLWRATDPGRGAWQNVQYEIYASARLRQQSKSLTFDEAFRQAFRDRFTRLDDPAASIVIRALGVGPARAQAACRAIWRGEKENPPSQLPTR